MKSLIIAIAFLASSANALASTVELYGKGFNFNDMEIGGIASSAPGSRTQGAVEIEVANSKKGETNYIRINKYLLAVNNMDSASFMQLVMNDRLDVRVFCTSATTTAKSLYYDCGGLSVTVSSKK